MAIEPEAKFGEQVFAQRVKVGGRYLEGAVTDLAG
jgi:hypothetical protein